MILEPFGGIGGFSEALRMHGRHDSFLIESAPAAVRIARLNGHAAALADVTRFSPWEAPEGIAAGPPCQGFSAAGKQRGRADIPSILEAARAMATARYPHVMLTEVRKHMHDHRSALVLEPWRLFLESRPRWMVLEQVPAVLPLWELLAELARDLGYGAWSGKVCAEQFDVAQTRRRSALKLCLDLTDAELAPVPVRSRYHERSPERLDPGMPRWLSMVDVIPEWKSSRVGFPRIDDMGTSPDGYRERDWRDTDRPSFVISGKTRSWSRIGMGDVRMRNGTLRQMDQPVATLTGSLDNGDPLTIREAATLQSFRPDFQLVGTRTAQFQAIGNAIPPMLAYHLFRGIL